MQYQELIQSATMAILFIMQSPVASQDCSPMAIQLGEYSYMD